MRSRLHEEEFICNNKNCNKFEVSRKSYVWSDREKNPSCIYCKQELAVFTFKKGVAPAVLTFNTLSAAGKRQMLKKRSNEHFHKKEKEGWLHRVTQDS